MGFHAFACVWVKSLSYANARREAFFLKVISSFLCRRCRFNAFLTSPRVKTFHRARRRRTWSARRVCESFYSRVRLCGARAFTTGGCMAMHELNTFSPPPSPPRHAEAEGWRHSPRETFYVCGRLRALQCFCFVWSALALSTHFDLSFRIHFCC